MKFSREQLELYVKTLKRIKTNRYDKFSRICFNLYRMSGEKDEYITDQPCYEFMREYSLGWEHHSGIADYPIPETPGEPFFWEGEALKYRLSLIDYIINKVEKELNVNN